MFLIESLEKYLHLLDFDKITLITQGDGHPCH